MAKLLKKHFGLGSKKAAANSGGGGRSDYSSAGAQKSSSAQDLIAQYPTRGHSQPSAVLSATSHHEYLCDTHSLKSVTSDTGGGGGHSHCCCCKHHGGGGHACSRWVHVLINILLSVWLHPPPTLALTLT